MIFILIVWINSAEKNKYFYHVFIADDIFKIFIKKFELNIYSKTDKKLTNKRLPN